MLPSTPTLAAAPAMQASPESSPGAPGLDEIRVALQRLQPHIVATPLTWWGGVELPDYLGSDVRVAMKLELFQYSGSFKARGALLNMMALDADQLRRGVTTVSSGNHAIATVFAARQFGAGAKVVMLQSANPARVDLCRRLGGEVLMAADGASAFALAETIAVDEGRAMIHPYGGAQTILGTATLGYELMEQAAALEAVIIPIGGGGLCAGMAAAIKQVNPDCRVYGVEPVGADAMHRSFALGEPAPARPVHTIADSLGAPYPTALSFDLCRRFVDDLVLVDDDEIRKAMALIFRELKLAVEPAAAAATAALIGPLNARLRAKRVGLVICGTNIDFATYADHLSAAP